MPLVATTTGPAPLRRTVRRPSAQIGQHVGVEPGQREVACLQRSLTGSRRGDLHSKGPAAPFGLPTGVVDEEHAVLDDGLYVAIAPAADIDVHENRATLTDHFDVTAADIDDDPIDGLSEMVRPSTSSTQPAQSHQTSTLSSFGAVPSNPRLDTTRAVERSELESER